MNSKNTEEEKSETKAGSFTEDGITEQQDSDWAARWRKVLLAS